MKKAIAVLFAVAVLAVGVLAAEKALYKTSRLSLGDVAISCHDGRAPTIQKMSDERVVIVSCRLGRNQD